MVEPAPAKPCRRSKRPRRAWSPYYREVIDTVLLDLGNVLLFHDNALLSRRFAERCGLSPEEIDRRLGTNFWADLNVGRLQGEAVRREACRVIGVELSAGEFHALFNCHFTIHEEVLPLVEGLVGRVRLALLSNTNSEHAAWFLPRLPLLRRFDAVLLSHEVGLAKPDPGFYRAGLERLGARPETTAFFDDIPAYVEAARALGIHAERFTDAPTFARQLAALGL
jgi:putative hydrolase of the HAD superfamily